MALQSTKVVNLGAVLSILFANFVMTINQVNISSIFTFGPLSSATSISREFDLSVYGLGILTSVFFLAYGGFELPGGILAARAGPRKLAIFGTVANTAGVLGSAVAPQFGTLVVLRFIAGFGFSFAFPSMLFLMLRYYKAGSEGVGVALTAVSFALGSVCGYFGWAVLGAAAGWRDSLAVAGLLDAVSVGAMLATLPQDSVRAGFRLELGTLRGIIISRPLVALSMAFFGIGSAYGLVSNFMIYYLEGNFQLSPGLAGGIASISTVLTVSAPVVGRLYDRVRDVKRLLFVPAACVLVGVGVASVDSIYAALLSVIICGFAAGAFFTVGLAIAGEIASSYPSYESMTIAYVDSFSLLGNSVSSLYFSAIVVAFGYPYAWFVGALVGVALITPVLFVKNGAFMKRAARLEKT